MTTTTKTLTIEDIEWTITPLSEDQSPEDCFDAAIEEHEATCKRIREDAQWNEWAWCCVEMKGSWNGIEAVSYLGACSYKNKSEFEADDYYSADLKREVLAEIQAKAERIAQALNS